MLQEQENLQYDDTTVVTSYRQIKPGAHLAFPVQGSTRLQNLLSERNFVKHHLVVDEVFARTKQLRVIHMTGTRKSNALIQSEVISVDNLIANRDIVCIKYPELPPFRSDSH